MEGELGGGAHNTQPIPFSPGVNEVRFPTRFVQPRPLLTRTSVTITMSSAILEINSAPKFASLALPPPPKRKILWSTTRSVPLHRPRAVFTSFGLGRESLRCIPAPMTPASAIPLPRSPPLSTHLVFSRPSVARLLPVPVLGGLSVPRGAGSLLPRPFTSSISFEFLLVLSRDTLPR